MKALNIIGIVASAIVFFITWYYAVQVTYVRNFFATTDDMSYDEVAFAMTGLTHQAVGAIFLLTAFFLVQSVVASQRARSKKRKRSAYFFSTLIGLNIAYLVLIYGSPMKISFDEAAPVFYLFGATMLLASIVYLRAEKVIREDNEDIIDDII